MKNNVQALILHCSASPDHPALEDAIAIKRYHIDEKGWSDIGYHYVVEDVKGHYKVIKGRPDNIPGAQCKAGGMNDKSLGICMVGGDQYLGFSSKYPLPRAQWEATVELCADLCQQYNLTPKQIFPHSYFESGKTCPGVDFDIVKFRIGVGEILEEDDTRARDDVDEAEMKDRVKNAISKLDEAIALFSQVSNDIKNILNG